MRCFFSYGGGFNSVKILIFLQEHVEPRGVVLESNDPSN